MSDDNVVTFGGNKPVEKEEYLLVCTKCDNRTFDLYAGGKITCAFCDAEVISADDDDNRAWCTTVGEPKAGDDIHTPNGSKEVTDKHIGDVVFARRLTMKHFNEWDKAGTMVMAIGYNSEGRGQHWFDITSEEQREWVLEKFEMLRQYIAQIEIGSATRQDVTAAQDSNDDKA